MSASRTVLTPRAHATPSASPKVTSSATFCGRAPQSQTPAPSSLRLCTCCVWRGVSQR
ncbi:hypothetical protein T484DRAFT_1948711 [Baffinella frigidus]|nr:hypothetical protein T484DRAFT_1948711 [Cryptophyta sp. CCMP2293]